MTTHDDQGEPTSLPPYQSLAERQGLSKAATELAHGVGLDPERGEAPPADLTDEDRERIAADPASVDDVVARLSRKPTPFEAALRNKGIYVVAIGLVVLAGAAAWIFN